MSIAKLLGCAIDFWVLVNHINFDSVAGLVAEKEDARRLWICTLCEAAEIDCPTIPQAALTMYTTGGDGVPRRL